MKLDLIRKYPNPDSIVGELLIDGLFFCYTLEDVERNGPKVPGKTAIPRGTYKVIIDQSIRFKRPMPHLLDVPGFEGIRIHAGNTAADTEGCILLGQEKGDDLILKSRVAFDSFFLKLSGALANKEEVIIEIKKEEKP
jgi:hypothetical protein